MINEEHDDDGGDCRFGHCPKRQLIPVLTPDSASDLMLVAVRDLIAALVLALPIHKAVYPSRKYLILAFVRPRR